MSTLETFEPRKTPRVLVILSDFFVAGTATVLGSGAWLLSNFYGTVSCLLPFYFRCG